MQSFNSLKKQAGFLYFLMYPEGTAKSMAWVTATFNLSTAGSANVSLYSEVQS
jgi:hypothetical protein